MAVHAFDPMCALCAPSDTCECGVPLAEHPPLRRPAPIRSWHAARAELGRRPDALAGAAEDPRQARTCRECGRSFLAAATGARYCGSSCASTALVRRLGTRSAVRITPRRTIPV